MEYSSRIEEFYADAVLSETIDKLIMANGVWWLGYALRRKYGHVLGRAVEFDVEGKRKRWR